VRTKTGARRLRPRFARFSPLGSMRSVERRFRTYACQPRSPHPRRLASDTPCLRRGRLPPIPAPPETGCRAWRAHLPDGTGSCRRAGMLTKNAAPTTRPKTVIAGAGWAPMIRRSAAVNRRASTPSRAGSGSRLGARGATQRPHNPAAAIGSTTPRTAEPGRVPPRCHPPTPRQTSMPSSARNRTARSASIGAAYGPGDPCAEKGAAGQGSSSWRFCAARSSSRHSAFAATRSIEQRAVALSCVTVRVVVAEDHFLMREGIRTPLDLIPDIAVVAACVTYDELIAAIAGTEPDSAHRCPYAADSDG
jgi:hypothetical protein